MTLYKSCLHAAFALGMVLGVPVLLVTAGSTAAWAQTADDAWVAARRRCDGAVEPAEESTHGVVMARIDLLE